jgi:hypothetical protein
VVGINPFAKKAEPELLFDAFHNGEKISDIESRVLVECVQKVEPVPTAWQRIFGIAFGEGVRLVAAATEPPRVSKRRMRRLRGRAKEARRRAHA